MSELPLHVDAPLRGTLACGEAEPLAIANRGPYVRKGSGAQSEWKGGLVGETVSSPRPFLQVGQGGPERREPHAPQQRQDRLSTSPRAVGLYGPLSDSAETFGPPRGSLAASDLHRRPSLWP